MPKHTLKSVGLVVLSLLFIVLGMHMASGQGFPWLPSHACFTTPCNDDYEYYDPTCPDPNACIASDVRNIYYCFYTEDWKCRAVSPVIPQYCNGYCKEYPLKGCTLTWNLCEHALE